MSLRDVIGVTHYYPSNDKYTDAIVYEKKWPPPQWEQASLVVRLFYYVAIVPQGQQPRIVPSENFYNEAVAGLLSFAHMP
jgi:hypothetical protein